MALGERVRVAAPDGLVAQVDGVTGRRYTATGGGMYEMHPRDAKALLAVGGFMPSIGGPTIRGGYACPGCGFRAVVRLCSRCGERCETDVERRARIADLGLPLHKLPAGLTDGITVVGAGPREAPMAMVTRPQDWAELARSVIFAPVDPTQPRTALTHLTARQRQMGRV